MNTDVATPSEYQKSTMKIRDNQTDAKMHKMNTKSYNNKEFRSSDFY